MFFSRKKNIIEYNLFENQTDHHSHILPGVDDGVRSVEEALRILEWYEQLGIKRVIFTPHVMENYPENNEEFLKSKFDEFKVIYNGAIELSLAAEYMIDSNFGNRLANTDLLTLWDNYLLVESSYIAAPIAFFQTINNIMSSGYFVVLAHPERYMFLSKNEYKELKQMGVLFQLNINSILGGYGESVNGRAMHLLRSGVYNLVGSDIHSYRYQSNIYRSAKISEETFKMIRNI